MRQTVRSWVPAGLMAIGIVLVRGGSQQQQLSLRMPLEEAVPAVMEGVPGAPVPITEEEQRVAGMTSYVLRSYGADPTDPAFTLYVGYYDSQTQGKTIHSPRNCLPGAGWEAIGHETWQVATASGPVTVNRYLIQRGQDQAYVLYWYQGRGRVAASEYRVKVDLLRDAALRRRTEEALVRVMVPIREAPTASIELAERVAAAVVPAVFRALPEA